MLKNPQKDDDPGRLIPSRNEAWDGWARRWSVLLWLRGGLAILLLTVLLMGTSHVSGHQLSGGGGGDTGDSGSGYTPTFQDAPCPFTLGAGIVEGQQVRCGYVIVPQNRNVNDGKTVKLAVAVFKAPQYMHSVDPAPVINLEGGPGSKSLDARAAAISAAKYNSWIFNHDLVLFDQRGTGYSTPSLDCPEEKTAPKGEIEQAVHACHDRLVSMGIDLDGFNTLQDAADVADLIHALGYQRMTLYGSSYGTRWATTVMRLYPEVVRAVVLDSVVSPSDNRNKLPSYAQRAFTTLFHGCAADPGCNAKYPNLQSVFENEVDQMNAHPISFSYTDPKTKQKSTVIAFTGDQWVTTLFNDLYNTFLIPRLPKEIYLIPQLIYQVKSHDYTLLATTYGEAGPGGDDVSTGMYYSTRCSENWPFLTEQDIINSVQGVTPQIAGAMREVEQEEYDVCQFWKVPATPPAQRQPVSSSLPALIVTGQYDPATPPYNGQEVAQYLSHSYFFLFPGQGHGELYNSTCSNQIISAFEDDPYQQPDSSCISQMKGPAFI